MKGRGLRILLLLSVLVLLPGSGTGAAGTQAVLLGTGTPNADPERAGPATALVVNDAVYLVDCGAGVVRRAAAAGLKMAQLKRAFVTHLHSDHTVGYPDLIFTPWVLGRTEPLEVYGPKGLRAMTEHVLAAWEQDIDIRINGLEPANTTGYKVEVHEIEPGVVYKDANVTVTAFRVPHGSWAEAFGYRFETADRTIVISGDTTASGEMIKQARAADVLIHEVYSTARFARLPAEWQRYHAAFHTSSKELTKIAAEAKPKLLVLYHCLFWGTREEELLAEIQRGYAGRVVVGRDLGIY